MNENGHVSVFGVLKIGGEVVRVAVGFVVKKCFLGYVVYTVNPAGLILAEGEAEELSSGEVVGPTTLARMNYYGSRWRTFRNLDRNIVAGIAGSYLATVHVDGAVESVCCPRYHDRTGLVIAALVILS